MSSPQRGRRNAAATFIGGEVPTVDAASVLLVRDGDDGLEVLLVERHIEADFSGGALVFPGGKVMEQDRSLPADRWTGVDPQRWVDPLGAANAGVALGLLVAAVRETFEEAGILLATRDGQPIDPRETSAPGFVAVRRALCERGRAFDWRPWLAEEGLVLDLASLALFAWWVTPQGQHKRFDTRFLIARPPAGQLAAPDDIETTALRWSTPDRALTAQRRGEATVIFPTRRILAALGEHASASAVWSAADAGAVDQRRVQPTLVHRNDQVFVRHPFDGTVERV